MKNTVYSLARTSSAASMEEFAMELTDFLLGRNPQVSRAEVSIQEKHWEHLKVQSKPHPTTFVNSSGENQTTNVSRTQGGAFCVASGLQNLVIMKTAGSAVEGYIKDFLTRLAKAGDRLFGTAGRAGWRDKSGQLDFLPLRRTIRKSRLGVIANQASK